MPKRQCKGKFWPHVRALIWEKAEELFMQDQARTMDCYIKPERCELREGGYFYQAKLIVLRNLWRERKGLPSVEEEEALRAFEGDEGEA
jgi:hypothetical protein